MSTPTAPRPRFIADDSHAQVAVPCYGTNHRDSGVSGHCSACGAPVARKDNGAMYPIVRRGTYSARQMACWSGRHECDPDRVVAHTAATERSIARGEIVRGAPVRVVKGRKVAIGTEGVVFWTGESAYGPRLGLRTADGTRHFLAAANVEPAA